MFAIATMFSTANFTGASSKTSLKTLSSVRVDVAGAMRFGVTDGQLTRRTSVARFLSLATVDVKVCYTWIQLCVIGRN